MSRTPFAPPTASDAPASGTAEAILTVVNHLAEAVRSENEDILGRCPAVDHNDYNLKKSHALLVMSRFAPLFSNAGANPALRAALLNLRSELETNRRLLEFQLRAAQAVSDLITRAIREGQSDGTYSPRPWRDDAA